MWTKCVVSCLLWVLTPSGSQFTGIRRIIGLCPEERPNHQAYRSSESENLKFYILLLPTCLLFSDQQNSRVKNWLNNYKDLLDQWVEQKEGLDTLKDEMEYGYNVNDAENDQDSQSDFKVGKIVCLVK